MKKIFAIAFCIYLAFPVLAQQRPLSLSKYDLNAPFGWATADSYPLTGGKDKGSTITLVSNGQDMRSEIATALNNNRIIILDGSQGDFLIGEGGLNLSSSASVNRTIVGINGAVLRQINTVEKFHSYLNERFKEVSGKHSGGYVKSKYIDIPEEKKWYVSEGDELWVRGFLIDYLYEQGERDTEKLLAENYKNWGVLRVNSKETTGCNIIIRNLTFVGPGALDLSGQDAFCLVACHNVWVDHCAFIDGQDGNLDIVANGERGSTNITVSWCTFHYTEKSFNHRFNTLLSGLDDKTLNVTFANCIWGGGIYMRTPLCNHSHIHMINNMFDSPGPGLRVQNSSYNDPSYCVWLDHCYFTAGKNGSGTREYITWEKDGRTCYNKCSDNYFANCEIPKSNAGMSVPYTYQPFDARLVPTVLTAPNGAGPTLTDPLVIGDIVY